MHCQVQLALLGFLVHVCNSWIVNPGPEVIATKGEVWPKPQREVKRQQFYILHSHFHINIISARCSLLDEAKDRYTDIILTDKAIAKKYSNNVTYINGMKIHKFIGYLKSLDVSLSEPCSEEEYPELGMDEEYTLTIPMNTSTQSLLTAKSIWGILRGLETFSQSVYWYSNDSNLYINVTKITDYPRFPHRGLLLDTSRHYLSMDILYKHIDAMSYNKMNVFHWHIVDDQSFPFQSTLFPELSNKGAYHPVHQIYTPTDVKAIIEYARLRGIRVVPEFDTPGHTRSWGQGIPELLAKCYKNGKHTGRYGPMDPSREFVFSFLSDFFDEIKSIFPDKYLHLGGDEVQFDCWRNNPVINNFMRSMSISGKYVALQTYFMEKLLHITGSKNTSGIVWEEVYKSGTMMPKDTIIQVWYSGHHLLREIINSGRRALYSSCWYLSNLKPGGDWIDYYNCDPEYSYFNADKSKLLLGGEASMWTEYVDNHNVLPRTWPRASAAAEKLWSAFEADNIPHAKRRIEEHACRLNRRGIPAQPPNGPGYCLL